MQVGDKVDWYNKDSMKKGTGYWRGPGRLALLNPLMAFVQAGGRMIRRHMTHVRHTLQDTGLDVDGREVVDEVPKVDQVGGLGHPVDAPVERVVGGGEREPNAEVRDLTGRECIEQNPELWKQFNQIWDDEEKNVEQAEQADDLPGLIDSDDESDDEDGEHAERDVERVGEPDRRVTRSMTKNEAFVSLLAMISVAKLLRAKKKKAQEIRGTEVETPEFDQARQKELQSFIDTETYVEVDDDGQELLVHAGCTHTSRCRMVGSSPRRGWWLEDMRTVKLVN